MQGADGIAAATDLVVYVPDVLQEAGYARGEWFGSGTLSPESEKAKAHFFSLAFDFPGQITALNSFVKKAKEEKPAVESWGSVGLCWGGKIVVLASGEGTVLSASGQVHPGRLDADDARKITIPHIVLASNGEDKKIVDEYKEILGDNGYVEYYGTVHHGVS